MIDPERKFEFIITKIMEFIPMTYLKPKIHEKIEEIVDFIDPQTNNINIILFTQCGRI